MHHEGELKCEKCNISFENEDEMKKHMKEVHGEDYSDHQILGRGEIAEDGSLQSH